MTETMRLALLIGAALLALWGYLAWEAVQARQELPKRVPGRAEADADLADEYVDREFFALVRSLPH